MLFSVNFSLDAVIQFVLQFFLTKLVDEQYIYLRYFLTLDNGSSQCSEVALECHKVRATTSQLPLLRRHRTFRTDTKRPRFVDFLVRTDSHREKIGSDFFPGNWRRTSFSFSAFRGTVPGGARIGVSSAIFRSSVRDTEKSLSVSSSGELVS